MSFFGLDVARVEVSSLVEINVSEINKIVSMNKTEEGRAEQVLNTV